MHVGVVSGPPAGAREGGTEVGAGPEGAWGGGALLGGRQGPEYAGDVTVGPGGAVVEGGGKGSGGAREYPQTLSRRFMRWYARGLMQPAVKALVLLVFVGATAFFGYIAVEETTTGFELVDLTPDQSYVRNFFDTKEEMFGSVTGKLPTNLYFKDIDYPSADVQLEMTKVSDALLALMRCDCM